MAAELPEEAPEHPTHRIVENETPMPPAEMTPRIIAPEPDPVIEPKKPTIEAIVKDDAPAQQVMPIPPGRKPVEHS